jgi:hypothetical protein
MTIAKTILILVGVYVVLFQFNTDPIKYSLAVIWTYPAYTIVVAIGIAIVMICSLNLYRFMRLEVDSVDKFSKGSPTGISDAHALLKVRKLLRKPNISATNDEMVLHDLLLRYRRIYESLPTTMKAKPEINANALGLHRKSQFFLFRITWLREGLLFILHNDEMGDGSVKIRDFTTIPTIEGVKGIIGEAIPDKHIDLAIRSVTDWANRKCNIHNPDGYGGVGNWEANEKGSSWFLPLPLGDQYRSMIGITSN